MQTWRRRLTGLLAVLAIAGLLVGLPAVLVAIGANPFPGGLPSIGAVLGALTRPDDGTLLVTLIKIVAWVSWAFLAAAILVEIFAQMRGIKAPRLPGLSLPQGAAQRLVATAALLFATLPITMAASGALAPSTAPPASTPVATATAGASAAPTSTPAQTPAAVPLADTATRGLSYEVESGDSLESLAQHYLNDPARTAEILAANPGLADGALQPGTVLVIPAAEYGLHAESGFVNVTVVKGDTLSAIALEHLGDANRWPEIFEASKHLAQPHGYQLVDPDVIDIGWTVRVPATVLAQDAPAATPAPGDTHAARADAPGGLADDAEVGADAPGALLGAGDVAWASQLALGVGGLVSAGLVKLVGERRQAQQRSRRAGEQLGVADEDATAAEQALRAAADPDAVAAVDAALRTLARELTRRGQPLPDVRAARLTGEALSLYLAQPATLPTPWANEHAALVWSLRLDEPSRHGADSAVGRAPYPALVCVGVDDEGHVLLNLEHLRLLGITGDPDAARDVLAALALELATSVWADDLQVTIVGPGAGLADALRTGRVRRVASLAGLRLDPFTPEVVVVTAALDGAEQAALDALLAERPRAAAVGLIGATGASVWQLQLDAPGHAVIAPIGFEVAAQRLTPAFADCLRRLVDSVAPGHPGHSGRAAASGEPGLAEIDAITPVDESTVAQPAGLARNPLVRTPEGWWVEYGGGHADDPDTLVPGRSAAAPGAARPVAAPRLRLLGPVALQDAAGSVDPAAQTRLVELAAHLCLLPDSAPGVLDADLWPDRRDRSNLTNRHMATTQLRRWLGQDAVGDDYLLRDADGEARALSPAVTCDVTDWDALLAGGVRHATTEDLESALHLVRGVPFEGTHPRRYAWAEPLRQRLIAELVDASFELTRRRLLEGRWRSAELAVVCGLRAEPAHQGLWRLRILAARQSRNPAAEAAVIDRLLSVTDQLACELDPETESLLVALGAAAPQADSLIGGLA